MRTKDQERAKKAYEIVKNIIVMQVKDEKLLKKTKKNFKTLALKFPSMVLQCGVLQALAYYKQKDASDQSGVFKELNIWLIPILSTNPGDCIVEKTASSDIWQYQMVTREAIAFGVWLKRAASTLLADVETDE